MILINVIAVSYTHLIEKTHGDRFGQLAKWIENNELYSSTSSIQWMCLNCAYSKRMKYP